MMKEIHKYYSITIVFIMICTSVSIHAQHTDARKILENVALFYKNTAQYQIDVTYNMHRGFTGNNITESYTGEMVKNGDFSKFKVLNSEIIYFSDDQLTISHTDKTIAYSKKTGTSVSSSPVEIEGFLKFYDQIAITEKNGQLKCEMVSSKYNPSNPYGKVIIYINKDKYYIEKQELFFAESIPFVDEKNNERESDVGRLVILLKQKSLEDQTRVTLQDYFTFSSGKKVILSSKYSEYNFINQAN
ncbi:hypothetical protein [uncultured Aquimarina sp.]|uniref:hypothetical protein n=1 Tax=uncultured Aquimarina sp. TaxID=575652 RepID=UPI00261A1736|nr:hypothetical protein [uncultured Aquimarina sp.]